LKGPFGRKLAELKKGVRKASFYLSRDPDLIYRIWPLIVPEDEGPPRIPLDVEDAKAPMFDFTKRFEVLGASLGRGTHRLAAVASVKWGRQSYTEKSHVEGRSRPVMVKIE